MCYPAKCSTCGKTTWAGCGKHVPSVYAKVAKDDVCMCKGWPGVSLPKADGAAKGPGAKEEKKETTATSSV